MSSKTIHVSFDKHVTMCGRCNCGDPKKLVFAPEDEVLAFVNFSKYEVGPVGSIDCDDCISKIKELKASFKRKTP